MLTGFYTAYVVFSLTPYAERVFGGRPGPVNTVVAIDRARIVATAEDRRTYTALVAAVRRHARAGDYVYAEPECPEVNFLTATRSPTRNVYSDLGDPATRTPRALAALTRHDVRVAVINTEPSYFGALPPQLLAALRGRYPHQTTIGKYEIRWRD
jgi:hypothetical protein